MSFRNRPVLDRKHRPRWQDERQFQQLLIAGFALAIAISLGIFGATAWSGYYDNHLRQVALVEEESFNRDALRVREAILRAEIFAEALDLESQLGGFRDAIIEQQLEALTPRFQRVGADAMESLVNGAFHRAHAADYGVSISSADVDTAVAQRRMLPERLQLAVIVREALPDDAEVGAEATEEDFARAEAEATAIRERIEGGEDFGVVALLESQDVSAQNGGEIGLIQADDPFRGEFFEAARDAEPGDLVGPVRIERGYALIEVSERIPPSPDERLPEQLANAGVTDAQYREYVRDLVLDERFREHFNDTYAVSPQPQRQVAQIFLRPDPAQAETGTQHRIRHILVQPLEEPAADQLEASEEEWDAALERARQLRDELREPDADWDSLAEEYSGDPGSAQRGGELGWYHLPTANLVPEFAATAAGLEVGEVSDPIRTQFGWHIIEVIGERESAAEHLDEIMSELRDDPDAFGAVARRESEDYDSAQRDGVLGWVARHELDPPLDHAIHGLHSIGEISEPVVVAGEGTYVYRLLETAEAREIDEDRLARIRASGYDSWLADRQEGSRIWIDPEFQAGLGTI